LTHEDLEFFAYWENLITIEEQGIERIRAQLCTLTAAERENHGRYVNMRDTSARLIGQRRCFADMMILEQTDGPIAAGFHRNTVTFGRAPQSPSSSSFLDCHMEEEDRIVLSIDPDLLSLARGVIQELSATRVVIGTEERLDVQALLQRNGRNSAMPVVWRLDKDDMLAGPGKMRINIAQLFRAGMDGDYRRRHLIVHSRSPRFEEGQARDETISGYLNCEQSAALHKVLAAKDYALIAGPPGTGKQTTIVETLLALAKRGKSVLLTSTTHAAVDNILLRLLDCGHRILRIGHIDKVGLCR
jgi:DNA replication ATP-dependent helicase Dna2